MTRYNSGTVQSCFAKQNQFVEELGAPELQKLYNVEDLRRKVPEVLNNTGKK
jgi:hypothetical protein